MFDTTNLEKYELANKWLHLQNKRISILGSLRKKGIDKIIIYGASDFALRFMEQCKNEQGVDIIAIADKAIIGSGEYYQGIPLVPIDDMQTMQTEGVCIVITAVGFQDEIVHDFMNRGIGNYILLKELIYDAY